MITCCRNVETKLLNNVFSALPRRFSEIGVAHLRSKCGSGRKTTRVHTNYLQKYLKAANVRLLPRLV